MTRSYKYSVSLLGDACDCHSAITFTWAMPGWPCIIDFPSNLITLQGAACVACHKMCQCMPCSEAHTCQHIKMGRSANCRQIAWPACLALIFTFTCDRPRKRWKGVHSEPPANSRWPGGITDALDDEDIAAAFAGEPIDACDLPYYAAECLSVGQKLSTCKTCAISAHLMC